MWDRTQRLHEYHSEVPLEVRILKLTEEVGEVAEAFIGMRGLNSRKGPLPVPRGPLDELADVIITAAVAMSAAADNSASEAATHLERRLDVVTARASVYTESCAPGSSARPTRAECTRYSTG